MNKQFKQLIEKLKAMDINVQRRIAIEKIIAEMVAK